jgi:hypothetical protein
MTSEQFDAAIKAAAEAGAKVAVEAMRASGPAAPTGRVRDAQDVAGMTDETFAAMVADRRGHDRPAIPEERVENCESTSGARFTAVISHGKVKVLENYEHPAGAEIHQAEGGIVPDGFPIRDTHGKLEPKFKQWKWEAFWQADINTFIGKPLPAHFCAYAASAKTAAAE